MGIRMGDILVSRGVLTDGQRRELLAAQASTSRPFGVLAEELFGVAPFEIEQAWAAQYAQQIGFTDLESCVHEPEVREILDCRQAWQFQLVPMRFVGNELIFVTTQRALPRAMRFAGWAIGHVCAFKLVEDEAFEELLTQCYDMPGGRSVLKATRLSA